jgi:UDP-N-acetylmuramate-alanine ligase
LLGADMLDEHTIERLVEEVAENIAPGDVLLTLGAGDIRKVFHAITGRLQTYRAAG